jgi:hypothetical protein
MRPAIHDATARQNSGELLSFIGDRSNGRRHPATSMIATHRQAGPDDRRRLLAEFCRVVDALRCASEMQGCTAEPDTPGLDPVAESLATY